MLLGSAKNLSIGRNQERFGVSDFKVLVFGHHPSFRAAAQPGSELTPR